MIGRRGLLASLATLAVTAALPRQARATAAANRLEPLIEQFHLGGVAIVATEQGREVERAFFGNASPAFAIRVDERTLFNVGSIGKHVTAVAILRLVEQGKLGLDDPLGKHLANLSPSWSRPSIRQILSHTSGLPGNFETQDLDRPFNREIVSSFSRSIATVAPPGHAWVYSNVGYVLLGYVIENLSGQTYADHITYSLFRAFGLQDSRADDAEALIPYRAEPVQWEDGSFRRALQMSREVSSVAAGGLVFSARDIPAWERALIGPDLLSPASKQAMYAEAKLDTKRGTSYGLGWRIMDELGRSPVYFHTGSVPGFSAAHVRIPEGDRAVMVMATGYGPMNGMGFEITEQEWAAPSLLSRDAIPDNRPKWTEIVRSIVLEGKPVSEAWLSPELARLAPEIASSTMFRVIEEWRPFIRSFTLVADQLRNDERRRRYVIDLGSVRLPLLASHTLDGAIVRISA
jgi:D-alanyl-D-alanine carboxypeptidase